MSAVLPVYSRCDLQFERGEGIYLYGDDGKKYIDFAAGIAVNSLGHAHPHVVEEMTDQISKLLHVSNLYKIDGLEKLASRLADNTFADKIFFCNSGAEAVECGLKMIRKYHFEKGNENKYRVITFEGSFHGRTMATISAAKKDKVMRGFEPALDGFDQVPFGDLEAVKNIVSDRTAGILIEPILGEGGILPAEKEFLQGLRKICDENDILLFFDEIQCGMGRTGTLYAYEVFGVEPDILSSAKGLGNGFPIGACLANDKAASGMTAGSHGSTYGNNPLAMRVGNAVLDIILEDGFLENVKETGDYFISELNKIKDDTYPQNEVGFIEEVRGMGLMIGVKIKGDSREFVSKLREKGLLTVAAADNVVRILPPLIITKKDVDEAIVILKNAIEEER